MDKITLKHPDGTTVTTYRADAWRWLTQGFVEVEAKNVAEKKKPKKARKRKVD